MSTLTAPPFHDPYALMVNAPDCVKVLAADGQIRFINEFGLELLGAPSPETILGRSYLDSWPKSLHSDIREALHDAAMGRHTKVEGLRLIQGRWRWWEAHFHGVDGNGNEREIICISRDTTERRERELELAAEIERLQDQLAEAERQKVAFIATLAHELRNPLAPVRTGLNVLKHFADDRSTVERVHQIMERQVGQLVRLINDLLDIARVSSGKIQMERSLVDLELIIRDAVDATAPLMAERQHHLTQRLSELPTLLLADAARLSQVFTNLLNNAAKYTPVGGQVSIVAERSTEVVTVTVSDSGIGLAPQASKDIFDMFTSIGPDAAGVHEGLGIGLNIVRRIIEMHQGSVTASSEGVGKGSQFIVTLPVPPAGGTVAKVDEVRRHDQAINILLVDDNVDAATTLALLLDYDHHVIKVANSGAEALRIVPDFRPDIVFLDLGMPGMDGLEVARAIRKMPESGDPLLVALTGWGGATDRERTKSAGFDEHLTKPADMASTEKMLHRIKLD